MKTKTLMLAAVLAASSAAHAAVVATADHPNARYKVGETANFVVTVTPDKDIAPTGEVSVVVYDWGEKQVSKDVFVYLGAATFKVPAKIDRPGFWRCVADVTTGAKSGKAGSTWGIACEPEKIRAAAPRPADFDAYWDGEVARLEREVPLDAKMTSRAQPGGLDKFDYYDVSFATFGGKRVYGILSIPKDRSKAPFPVRVRVPGAGPGWTSTGDNADAIVLLMNVHPFPTQLTKEDQKRLYDEENAAAKAKYGVATYAKAGISVSREEYFFHDAILGINRAVDWVARQPFANPKDVVYWHGSQGGAFGYFLLGLNRNFRRGVMFVTAMCDHLAADDGRKPGWPNLVASQATEEGRKNARRFAPYFDAVNFAPRIKIPVLSVAGFVDKTCHPATVWAAFNALGSTDKVMIDGLGMPHRLHGYLNKELSDWVSGSDTDGSSLHLRSDAALAKSMPADEFAIPRAEFVKYHEAITGTKPAADAVRFAIDPAISKHGNDAYAIRSDAKGAVLTGSNVRSVLYAVYDLLERRGGCRWFWDGDVVPKASCIDLSGLDVREESQFLYRGIRYFAHRGLTRFQAEHWGPEEWKREFDWMLKSRLNMFMLEIGLDDMFQRAFPEDCPYPDPAKPLRGAGKGYDNRSLFWSLEFRGKLRERIMAYAGARGLMATEDCGVMTHWYSRTPVEFLENRKPAFFPQISKSYAEPTGLIWDIRIPEWYDAYWKITETAISTYGDGRCELLHAFGPGERRFTIDPATNFNLKCFVNCKISRDAASRHPSATVLIPGWDFYYTWTADEVKRFLPMLDWNRCILLDYEADAYATNKTNFTEWDVIGKYPYVFGIFLAYESGLDIRADYDLIRKRQKLIQDDPMCKGYTIWPESSHTDGLALRYSVRNAWRARDTDIGELIAEFCRDRYGAKAVAFEKVWNAVVPISAKGLPETWRSNYGQHIIRLLGDKWDNCNNNPAKWPMRGAATYAALPQAFRDLAAIAPSGEFECRDAVDLARTAGDRLMQEAESAMMRAYFDWKAGDPVAKERFERAAAFAIRFAKLMGRILAQHTDYSLNDSLARLDKVEKIRNPDFGQVLLENAVNSYCASHQAEPADRLYPELIELTANEIRMRMSRGDKTPLSHKPITAKVNAFLARRLETLRPQTPRSPEAFRAALSDFAVAADEFVKPTD